MQFVVKYFSPFVIYFVSTGYAVAVSKISERNLNGMGIIFGICLFRSEQ